MPQMSTRPSNIAALNSLNSLNMINRRLSVAQARLATGRRINSAEDDPAGLSMATRFHARVKGLQVAQSSMNDAKNLLSVGEGALRSISDLLIVIRTKAESAASDTMGVTERSDITSQITDLLIEIDHIVDTTSWNGVKLIDGTFTSKVFQSGADAGEQITFAGHASAKATTLDINLPTSSASSSTLALAADVEDVVSTTVVSGFTELASGTYTIVTDSNNQFIVTDNLGNAVSISNASDASGALTSSSVSLLGSGTTFNTGRGVIINMATADNAANNSIFTYTIGASSLADATAATNYLSSVVAAIDTVSTYLTSVGSTMQRLSAHEQTLAVSEANTEAAFNLIMNADMAREQVEATKYLILQQTATAMLAQANSNSQSILSLFR